MNFDFIQQATSRELEQFKSVCNQLLSRTYVVRTLYRPGKGRVNNPDYTFLSLHYEAVQDYLGLLDWDLRKDTLNGYFYVVNTDEANRCNLNKRETAILLALRMIYSLSDAHAYVRRICGFLSRAWPCTFRSVFIIPAN